LSKEREAQRVLQSPSLHNQTPPEPNFVGRVEELETITKRGGLGYGCSPCFGSQSHHTPMNLFITGKPGSGKTTLIKELIPLLESPCGFYTEEIREGGRRVGFLLRTISGKEVIMAHIRFKTPYQVGRYRVEPSSIKIGVDEIKRGVEEGRWIIIDEIGKMELFSEEFKEASLSALERKRVLGTICLKDDSLPIPSTQKPKIWVTR
jgi:nucleoside-triphosphatase